MWYFLRSLFCEHDYQFAGNLYGDQINEWGGKRSVWTCAECGKTVARDHLHEDAGNEADK